MDAARSAGSLSAVDPRTFRDALGRFPTGVVVVSTRAQGECLAMTANAFMSGSLEPPLIVISIGSRTRMHRALGDACAFGIAILDRGDEDISRHFARQPVDGVAPRFRDTEGIPVLQAGSTRLLAKVVAQHSCGDHTLFVGEVAWIELAGKSSPPLVFHAGGYSMVSARACHA